MRLAFFGHGGKVGQALAPALRAAGHEVVGIGRGGPRALDELDAAVDFTRPDAVVENVRAALAAGLP